MAAGRFACFGIAQCGHFFCNECILKCCGRRAGRCPLCRQRVRKIDVLALHQHTDLDDGFDDDVFDDDEDDADEDRIAAETGLNAAVDPTAMLGELSIDPDSPGAPVNRMDAEAANSNQPDDDVNHDDDVNNEDDEYDESEDDDDDFREDRSSQVPAVIVRAMEAFLRSVRTKAQPSLLHSVRCEHPMVPTPAVQVAANTFFGWATAGRGSPPKWTGS